MTDSPRTRLASGQHRLQQATQASLSPWKYSLRSMGEDVPANVIVDCGWGRLLFGHTFESSEALAHAIQAEDKGRRDIAMYVPDPHIVLSVLPQVLFLDPSHTYRLYFEQSRLKSEGAVGFSVRKLQTEKDAVAVSRIYARRGMVPIEPSFIFESRKNSSLTQLVAEDSQSGAIVGTVMGVDHVEAFNDPEGGCSLWALAVDPQTSHSGVGQALVVHLVHHFSARARAYMDLSVMYNNSQAIRLYEKLGFNRVPVFVIKNRNFINEPWFTGHEPADGLNPYARIITREARRRGVSVEVLDAEQNYFALSFGGRTVVCRESLSELTSAIAMSRCDDKRVTHRCLTGAGLSLPEQIQADDVEQNRAFLMRHGRVVVKPARGEQGYGVSVGIKTDEDLEQAIQAAALGGRDVVLEQMVEGHDLRVIVIDYRVVAAAIRRPPEVVGDGMSTLEQLIEKQSRRRQAATDGESSIPLDDETERCVRDAGYALDSVLPAGAALTVRKAANLHTGGTIHDVSDELHPRLVEVAKRAAEVLDIPVVGLDLMVPSVREPQYWIIEANERPGLANHEPQPTAQRFVDLLFPQTVSPS